MIGVQAVSEAELCRVGTTAGTPIADKVYRCSAFVEKPSIDIARAQLRTVVLAEGQYLVVAVLLDVLFFVPVLFAALTRKDVAMRMTFLVSIVYLPLLLIAMVIWRR